MQHYKGPIEPFQVAKAWDRTGYQWVNILKYVRRAGRKPGASFESDMLKLIDYAWSLVYDANPETDFELPSGGIADTLRACGTAAKTAKDR